MICFVSLKDDRIFWISMKNTLFTDLFS